MDTWINMHEYYRDKVLLITGASMGIGKELAMQALSLGAKVVITGRNEEKLHAVKNNTDKPGRILIHSGNVASYTGNLKLVEKIINHFGRLDIVISNAGMSAYGDLELTKQEVADEIIDTNIKGSVFLYKAVIPELKKTRGSILFVSSLAALRGLPSYSLYSLSKMALTGLTQSIRIENKKYNVFVGIAYVGFTQNEEEKRTYSPEGNLEKVPQRNQLVTRSRTATARLILSQIQKKKNISVHSFIGKLSLLLSRYFPFIIRAIYEKNYNSTVQNTIPVSHPQTT
jgi:short-subunit dehydrogenase